MWYQKHFLDKYLQNTICPIPPSLDSTNPNIWWSHSNTLRQDKQLDKNKSSLVEVKIKEIMRFAEYTLWWETLGILGNDTGSDQMRTDSASQTVCSVGCTVLNSLTQLAFCLEAWMALIYTTPTDREEQMLIAVVLWVGCSTWSLSQAGVKCWPLHQIYHYTLV